MVQSEEFSGRQDTGSPRGSSCRGFTCLGELQLEGYAHLAQMSTARFRPGTKTDSRKRCKEEREQLTSLIIRHQFVSMPNFFLKTNQIQFNLRIAVRARPQVERRRRNLIN